jgi:GT2 family glycosyltransferase
MVLYSSYKMTKQPIFSVISVVHNREQSIGKTLESIKNQTFKDFEVIIVDAASKDFSRKVITQILPQAKIVTLKKNLGIANFNAGMRIARGNYFLSIDDDVVIKKDTLAKMYTIFSEAKTDILSFKILDGRTNRMVDNVGHSTKGSKIAGYATGYLNSAAWGLTREVFKVTGGYNKDYFIYVMEMELCTRAIQHGFRVRYFPSLSCQHYFAPSQERIKGKVFVARNWIYFITQYLPIWAIPVFIFWSILKVFYDTSKGYGKAGSYFQGFKNGLLKIPHFLKIRRAMSLGQTMLFMKTQFVFGDFTNKW